MGIVGLIGLFGGFLWKVIDWLIYFFFLDRLDERGGKYLGTGF